VADRGGQHFTAGLRGVKSRPRAVCSGSITKTRVSAPAVVWRAHGCSAGDVVADEAPPRVAARGDVRGRQAVPGLDSHVRDDHAVVRERLVDGRRRVRRCRRVARPGRGGCHRGERDESATRDPVPHAPDRSASSGSSDFERCQPEERGRYASSPPPPASSTTPTMTAAMPRVERCPVTPCIWPMIDGSAFASTVK
jgi:hypothetical protein